MQTTDEDTRRLAEEIYLEALKAREIVSRHARKTPLDHSSTFSRMSGGHVYLKYENLQKTGSFKIRGALYKVYRVRSQASGVVAASAGNHAQGVAYAARSLGLPSIIVMPETASISKVEATRGYGAQVVLYGKIYDEAEQKAREIAEEKGYAFIHPFDDPHVIAGQGTVALEILEDLSDIDVVVVPVGGGGLISGIAAVFKKLSPSTRIVGVEPENAPKFTESLRAGKPVTVEVRPTIADGLATKKPGNLTFRIVSGLVDKMVTVTEDELAKAIYLLLERGKVLAEGAGAAALAAILSGKVDVEGKRVVALVSGGNIDLTAIYRLLIRGLAGAGRIAAIQGHVPDLPGTLAKIASIIASYRGNIVEVIHDRADMEAPAWHTTLKIIFEAPSLETVDTILKELERHGYRFQLL